MAEIVEPIRLVAFEYRGRMKGGRSKPLLVACADESGNETQVVLKVRTGTLAEGSFGPCSLACELICSMLARAAGLMVPDYAIVEVEQDFAESVTDLQDRERLLRNIGENFGSVYQEDCAKFSPGLRIGDERQSELESILAFDDYMLNNDRQASNPNLLIRGDSIYLIDHSLRFPHLGSPEVRDPWGQLFPEESIRSHCTYPSLRQKGPDFQAFASFLTNEITDAEIRHIVNMVPDGWQRPEIGSIPGGEGEESGDRMRADKESILQYLLNRLPLFVENEPDRLAEVCGS